MASVLDVILPTDAQWALLRACLHDGEPGAAAWEAWERKHGGASAVLAGGIDGVKRLLPMLQRSQRRNDASVDAIVATCLRTAKLREEFRSNTYRSIANRALKTLADASVDFTVLKGAALAESVYDEPGERHCHDVDLLVRADQMDRAAAALIERESMEGTKDFRLYHRCLARGAETATIVHETGLPIRLHQNLFRVPWYTPAMDAIWNRCVTHEIAHVDAKILAPTDALLHVLGHAAASPVRSNAVWVCDAWMILEKTPDFDWQQFMTTAREARMLLPLAVILAAMHDRLDAPISEDALRELKEHAATTSVAELEAGIFGAASGPGGRAGDLKRHVTTGRERLALLKWMFLPSLRNAQAFYRIEKNGAVLPFVLFRPFRAILWRLFRKSWTAGPAEPVLPDFMAQHAAKETAA